MRKLLEYMDSGKIFSCKVVTYDKNRKKGGTIVEYSEAKQLGAGEGEHIPEQRPPTRIEAKRSPNKPGTKRNPNHRKYYTRNIVIYQNGVETAIKRKIHPPLIVEFNGKEVLV